MPLIYAVTFGIPLVVLVIFLRKKFSGFFAENDAIIRKIIWIVIAVIIAFVCYLVAKI